MRYAVIGSRTFADYGLLSSVLNKHFISQIVSGGARGADSLAARYALEKNILLLEFIPNYPKYGKSAPFVRNKQIVQSADITVAFWDMKSNGTRHALEYSTKLNKKTIIVSFDSEIHIDKEFNLWQI